MVAYKTWTEAILTYIRDQLRASTTVKDAGLERIEIASKTITEVLVEEKTPGLFFILSEDNITSLGLRGYRHELLVEFRLFDTLPRGTPNEIQDQETNFRSLLGDVYDTILGLRKTGHDASKWSDTMIVKVEPLGHIDFGTSMNKIMFAGIIRQKIICMRPTEDGL